jgi:hypothetical protein
VKIGRGQNKALFLWKVCYTCLYMALIPNVEAQIFISNDRFSLKGVKIDFSQNMNFGEEPGVYFYLGLSGQVEGELQRHEVMESGGVAATMVAKSLDETGELRQVLLDIYYAQEQRRTLGEDLTQPEFKGKLGELEDLYQKLERALWDVLLNS